MGPVTVTVFALAGVLGLISLLPSLAARLSVPFTVLLALLGCVLGIFTAFDQAGAWAMHVWVISDFINALSGIGITSNAFITIFLPILVFEASLSLDARALYDDLGPVLLLAIVAVVLTTLVAGLAVWAVSDLAFLACLLLAAIIATTDPVAVVAIFRDVGAPRRLTRLVEGESLLNDAAAIALFALILRMMTAGQTSSLTDAAASFAWDFIGGAGFGFVMALIACALIERLNDSRPAMVTLSLALPYLTFIIGEHYVQCSGIVAIVVAGLTFGTYGRTRIARADWDTIIKIWSQLSFWASSLIFVLASMIVPQILEHFRAFDLVIIAVLVVGSLIARAMTLYGLLPLLSAARIASRVEHRYKLVMLWGGMRGAVTLALAIGIIENPAISDPLTQSITVVAIGYVLFTLLVQAPTLKALIRHLGLDRLQAVDTTIRHRVMQVTLRDIVGRLEDAVYAYRIDDSAARSVERRYAQRIERLAGELDDGSTDYDAECRVGFSIVAEREVQLYRKRLDEGMVSPRIVALLIRRASALLDGLKEGGAAGYMAVASGQSGLGRHLHLIMWLHRHLGWTRSLGRLIAERLEILLVRGMVLRELRRIVQSDLGSLLSTAVVERIDAAMAQRIDKAETSLASLKLQYPDYGKLIETSYLSRAAMRMEETAYRDLHGDAIIGGEVLQDLMRELRGHDRKHARPPDLDLGLNVTRLVQRVPLFADLYASTIDAITALVRPRLAVPGERLVERGTRGDQMFFIASGAVEVRLPGGSVRLGSGDFIGEVALLTRRPRNADVYALTYCRLLILDGRDFRTFLRTDPKLRAHIQEVAKSRMRPSPPS